MFANSITGQVLRLSERREAVLFLYQDTLWVADFVDGEGELMDAGTWVRFNCGGTWPGPAHQRMVHESAQPLSEALAMRIGVLLQAHTPQEPGGAK
jgi:hypothetical protein